MKLIFDTPTGFYKDEDDFFYTNTTISGLTTPSHYEHVAWVKIGGLTYRKMRKIDTRRA